MALCELQNEIYCTTYDQFLPKMFNSKLIKPLVLVSTLQETQEIQEQVKQHYEKKTNPEGRALKKKSTGLFFSKSPYYGSNGTSKSNDVEKRGRIVSRELLIIDLLLEVSNKGSL